MDFFQSVWQTVLETSIIEWLAFITGIVYVILAAKENILCWLFAFVSSALFVYLCVIGQLYLESILQLFYVAMAIVGYVTWQKSKEKEFIIHTWSMKEHGINILVSGAVAFTLGFLFDQYTAQANPYVDSFTTVFSLAATFMVTRKVIGNWIYWIVIDLVSIYLYAQRGYELLAVQMFIFTILALFGFLAWRKQMQTQKP